MNHKVNTLLNTSNQASLIHTEHVMIYQANTIAIFGNSFSNRKSLYTSHDLPEQIKLSIKINQSGEIEISNSDRDDISKNIKILSDKKISGSEEGGD